ncbi:MAG: tRNA (adenosine(37)-N6)-threonylcarbamoyltransferase complex ATPase subunit type 1 TsaE [Arcobacter sp.]|nr:tRNA (adenosine(37)-N6)-threonylcarbamoyltransferase complex ATPase subunit type 1 TsaE [Arcobacter sp.]
MKEVFVCDLDNLDSLMSRLRFLVEDKNIVVLLRGDLASGKTTLVKQIVKTFGCDDLVTSPTFSLQSCYKNNLFHYDMYNKTLSEFVALGMLEEFEKDGVHFVEWGDDELEQILEEYGFAYLNIRIKKLEKMREYTIET